MNMYHDFHSHTMRPEKDVVRMICVKPGESAPPPFSSGIHPWDTEGADIARELQLLDRHAHELAAIGEIGLDRLRGAPLERQADIFRKQIHLAEKHGLSMIIHNVRCTPEIMVMLKNPARTLWHKAPTGEHNLHHIVNAGAMVSFTAAELAQVDPEMVPPTQLGLETDDTGGDIREAYRIAAELWMMPEEQLMEQLAANFHRLFTRQEKTDY